VIRRMFTAFYELHPATDKVTILIFMKIKTKKKAKSKYVAR